MVTNKAANACGVGDPALSNFIVDDLLIFVSLVGIDGVGKVLGQAGPCFIRTSNKLTVIGIMKFDTADLPNMEANGTLNDVILHEMGHVVGFGSIWDDPAKNFLVTPSSVCNPPPPPPANPCTVPPPTCDTHFSGAAAIRRVQQPEWRQRYTGAKVPVENTCGPGTRLSLAGV